MPRHRALVPLTHDHHHALAHARKLRESSEDEAPEALTDRARRFLEFFSSETLHHFREEEEVVFPLLVEGGKEPPEELVTALTDHVRMHALIAHLEQELSKGSLPAGSLRAMGTLLDDHILLEEKRLFPLIEKAVSDERLADVALSERDRSETIRPV